MEETLNRRDFLKKTAGIAVAPALLKARPTAAR
jgi:hypothetical protein